MSVTVRFIWMLGGAFARATVRSSTWHGAQGTGHAIRLSDGSQTQPLLACDHIRLPLFICNCLDRAITVVPFLESGTASNTLPPKPRGIDLKPILNAFRNGLGRVGLETSLFTRRTTWTEETQEAHLCCTHEPA